MQLNLDTIRSLDANKSYYISNKTQEIKEAGAWQKFKCWLGVGDGRQKAANLVHAVKTALLNEAGQVENDAMEGELDELKARNRSVSGSALKEIADRFAVANKDAIRATMESRAVAEAMANAEKALRDGAREQVESLARAAISACGGDKDVAMSVVRNIDNVLVGGDGKLRGADGVKKRVAGVKANFDELKQVASGDANILKFGAEFIDGMEGKGLPKGCIKALVDAAKSSNLGDVKDLDGDSSAYGIHCALKDLDKAINRAIGKFNVFYLTKDANELQSAIRFFTLMTVSSLGEKTCANIRSALATKGAAELARTYDVLLNARSIPEVVETDEILCRGISVASLAMRNDLNELKAVIDVFAGVPEKDVKFVKAVKGDFGADPGIIDELKATGKFFARQRELTKNEAYLAKFAEMGYADCESGKLRTAIALYSLAAECTVEEAIDEVLTPGTKANRLMQYGGRFTESVESFKDGLALIDKMQTWFDGMKTVFDTGYKGPKTTTSQQFATNATFLHNESRSGLEKFFFEDIAIDPNFNLKETDPEKAFGMRRNAASRFFSRGFGSSSFDTLAQMPPEKRRVLFAVADALMPLPKDGKPQGATVDQMPLLIGRVLRHLDEIEAHIAKGTLTAENIVKTCYPEVADNAAQGVKAINDFDGVWVPRAMEEIGSVPVVSSALIESGAPLDETIAALKEGRRLPNAPYVSGISYNIDAFDSLAANGRTQMLTDIVRPAAYKNVPKAGEEAVTYVQDLATNNYFGFTFPGGEQIKTNGTKYAANCNTVAGKVESLCGKSHLKQIGIVMYHLSQSGLGPLKDGLEAYGVASSEHSPVEYTLSKDETSGAVKIDIKSPDYLPVKFSWTVTVSIDGTTVSTPMQIEKKAAA